MSQINVDTLVDEAGTGPVNLNTGLSVGGNEIITAAGALTNVTSIDATTVATINSAIPAHNPVSVSGATQALNVGTYNFFNAGDLTVDTTLTFTSVPTDALWTYTAKTAILEDYSIQAAIYSWNSFIVKPQETSPTGIAFSSDGTKMFVTGDNVNQYTLITAWNLRTASFTTNFVVSGQDASPRDLAFSSDGTKMYVIGQTNDSVYQYTLGTAWDLSTASYASLSISVNAQDATPTGIAFSSDGTKMYVVGTTNDTVYQYTLGTAWDLSTATYASLSKSVAAQETQPNALAFSPDGTRMVLLGSTSVKQYTLGTAWNVSTATYDSVSFSVAAQEAATRGLAFSSDGTRMYIVGSDEDTVNEYYTTIISTITVPAAVQNPSTTLFYNTDQVSYTFVTNDGGTTVKLINEAVT
jgi:DNA-binding beta-propeller fold protein YncE